MGEKDFLNEIRQTEKLAADLLEQARETARLRQGQIREQTAAQLIIARDDARRLQQVLLADAEKQAGEIAKDAQAEAERSAAKLAGQYEKQLDVAARAIVERIVMTDAHR